MGLGAAGVGHVIAWGNWITPSSSVGLPESVSAVVLQELGRTESLAETPFGADPHAWLAAQRAAGADEAIVTVRTAEDVATVSAMMKR